MLEDGGRIMWSCVAGGHGRIPVEGWNALDVQWGVCRGLIGGWDANGCRVAAGLQLPSRQPQSLLTRCGPACRMFFPGLQELLHGRVCLGGTQLRLPSAIRYF